MTQSRPDLAVAFAMKGTGRQHAADHRCQRFVGHRSHGSAPSWRGIERCGLMAVDPGSGKPPNATDRRQAIRFASGRRGDKAHGLSLRRAKGRPVSKMAIFSLSRSRSISAVPSRALRRSFSSSSPVVGLVVSAASPAARKVSRQLVSVAAVTPSDRDTSSRSSPRSNRSTAAVLRCRDILPPRPGAAAPDSCGRSASPGRLPIFVPLSMIHLSRGKSSAYEVSQSTVEREKGKRAHDVRDDCACIDHPKENLAGGDWEKPTVAFDILTRYLLLINCRRWYLTCKVQRGYTPIE